MANSGASRPGSLQRTTSLVVVGGGAPPLGWGHFRRYGRTFCGLASGCSTPGPGRLAPLHP